MSEQDAPRNRLRRVDVETFPIQRASRGRLTKRVKGKEQPVGTSDAKRIACLVIPPAWKNVRISADPRSHIQAVGRDEAGRRQYIYHEEWEAIRSTLKARRLQRLIAALPRIRRTIGRDLDRSDNRRILAAAARLVERYCLRAGHEEYAGEESGRGAATLLKQHVRVSGDKLLLEFPGKGKKLISMIFADRKLTRNIAQCLRSSGRRLFRLDAARGLRNLTANDLNRYFTQIAKCEISAKDFRTLRASSLALARLAETAASPSAVRRREMAAIAKEVSLILCNTPSVVRTSYIHSAILERYDSGGLTLKYDGKRLKGCTKGESILLRFLAKESAAAKKPEQLSADTFIAITSTDPART